MKKLDREVQKAIKKLNIVKQQQQKEQKLKGHFKNSQTVYQNSKRISAGYYEAKMNLLYIKDKNNA